MREGHTLLTNLVVSGEVPFGLTVYDYMAEQAKRKGAPIDWIALEPVVAKSMLFAGCATGGSMNWKSSSPTELPIRRCA